MSGTVYMKRGDTTPPLRVTLTNGTSPVNLTGAEVFLTVTPWREPDATPLIDSAPMTGWDGSALGASGEVEYEWQVADTELAGRFSMEYRVEFGDGLVRSYPTLGEDELVIRDTLASAGS